MFANRKQAFFATIKLKMGQSALKSFSNGAYFFENKIANASPVASFEFFGSCLKKSENTNKVLIGFFCLKNKIRLHEGLNPGSFLQGTIEGKFVFTTPQALGYNEFPLRLRKENSWRSSYNLELKGSLLSG